MVLILAVLGVLLLVTAAHDLLQRTHAILRNYPVIGHARLLLERTRPEIQQYFIEGNYDRRPLDRDTPNVIYERAKGIHAELAFGTGRGDLGWLSALAHARQQLVAAVVVQVSDVGVARLTDAQAEHPKER